MKDILSYNIKKIRGKRPTQAELANRAGISLRTYSSIELGESWPEYENVRAIAGALGVPETALFADPNAIKNPLDALDVLRRYFERVEKDTLK